MAEIDAELLERVARWCAEAGRQTGRDEIRRALAGLSWDELLAARALLADPPPARPLGPFALADLARGAPPDLAAEREREGRYRSELAPDADADVAAAPPPPAPSRRGERRPPARRPRVVIRRARDAVPVPPAPRPRAAPLDELFRPGGRAALERLVRTHGPRRGALVAALAASWRGPGDAPPTEDDLAALLEHHGLAHAFERRERDGILHALRAAGGVRAAAAARLGLDASGLDAALARLGASADAERIREQRRADLRARATLSERVRLVLGEEERLRDLGVLAEFEQDLRARLPEHLRALRALAAPLGTSVTRSLSLTPVEARALAVRFGLDLGAGGRAPPRPPRAGAPTGRGAPAKPSRRGEPRARGAIPPGRTGKGAGPARSPRGGRRPTPGRRP